MMIEVSRNYWKELPDRDKVLDKIYEFMKSLSEGNTASAKQYALVSSMEKFCASLDKHLKQYAYFNLEDDELKSLSGDLSIRITDPEKMDEVQTFPEFSGSSMTVEEGEEITLRVGLNGKATGVKLHFTICEADELFFLKFVKVISR